MKKILICTTFRDFNGNENAQMQNLFLESLRAQTNKNWELVVTVFSEKNVQETLQNSGLSHKIYIGKTPGCRFSLSEVVLNCLDSADKDDIVIWTTSDIIYDKFFFEQIVNEIKKETIAISYPLKIYRSFDCYAQDIGTIFYAGIDSIIFSADIFLKNSQAMEDLTEFKFLNWGMFEFFLVGMGITYFSKKLIIAPNSIKKIENNRNVNNETYNYLESSNNRNYKVLQSFSQKYNLDNDFYRWILEFKTISFQPFFRVSLYLNVPSLRPKIRSKIKSFFISVILKTTSKNFRNKMKYFLSVVTRPIK